MKSLRVQIYAGLLLAAANNAALAQVQPPHAPAGSAVPVTVDNFNRAESDLVMGQSSKTAASASTSTTASYTQSTRPSYAPTATLCIRFQS
ncbi:hypothetical protein [Phyllobacterium zundukense]|uniref:Uncharacterized protein n=1 Tax=Phyllobacterium zundukense TaxID=1867719 RepID=A0A2N9W258_9HYPH|nr:hypothetical protein BLM14_05825 [Phyllobacterium zundukense]PIO45826.1 hypothetical protein B5P45_04605 [Phyllobacterium zundukense]